MCVIHTKHTEHTETRHGVNGSDWPETEDSLVSACLLYFRTVDSGVCAGDYGPIDTHMLPGGVAHFCIFFCSTRFLHANKLSIQSH